MSVSFQQLALFPQETEKQDSTSTFADNLSLPIHRWFRYSAGFSALWARELIAQEARKGRRHVLDPFVGSGTVLIESERNGIEAIGFEAHPFVARVAKAKLQSHINAKLFFEYGSKVVQRAKGLRGTADGYPTLITRCFPTEVLMRLDALRQAWSNEADNSPLSELAWLALTAILRECSPVGTAQWQYILPKKTKAKLVDPYEAFETKIQVMCADIGKRWQTLEGPRATLFQEDARACAAVADGWADLVVTSPPYANNYDYADATRLEMTFFGAIHGWGDLQQSVRQYLVPSCTQHVAKQIRQTQAMIADPLLTPIHDELSHVCEHLQRERETHGGKKPYHTMIAAYFGSMARVWQALRRSTKDGALVCFVIGDSAPYGVHVPVEQWLGRLAVASGFTSFVFEKTRDRNTKWKNRKHDVPLHEGRLWVRN